MRIARRKFVLATGAFAAWPALAKLSPLPGGAARELPASLAAEEPELVFRIDGWSPEQPPLRDERWLTINKSYRTAWR